MIEAEAFNSIADKAFLSASILVGSEVSKNLFNFNLI